MMRLRLATAAHTKTAHDASATVNPTVAQAHPTIRSTLWSADPRFEQLVAVNGADGPGSKGWVFRRMVVAACETRVHLQHGNFLQIKMEITAWKSTNKDGKPISAGFGDFKAVLVLSGIIKFYPCTLSAPSVVAMTGAAIGGTGTAKTMVSLGFAKGEVDVGILAMWEEWEPIMKPMWGADDPDELQPLAEQTLLVVPHLLVLENLPCEVPRALRQALSGMAYASFDISKEPNINQVPAQSIVVPSVVGTTYGKVSHAPPPPVPPSRSPPATHRHQVNPLHATLGDFASPSAAAHTLPPLAPRVLNGTVSRVTALAADAACNGSFALFLQPLVQSALRSLEERQHKFRGEMLKPASVELGSKLMKDARELLINLDGAARLAEAGIAALQGPDGEASDKDELPSAFFRRAKMTIDRMRDQAPRQREQPHLKPQCMELLLHH
jgi:hypothetical protein